MQGLENKKVLITGGASGIGAAAAERFLQEGAIVVVLDRDRIGCERIKEEHPDILAVLQADVSNPDELTRAFDELDNVVGNIDVLINNAGISIRHSFMEITEEEWRKVLAVNLDGVFYVSQRVAHRMLGSAGGVIVNVGSTNGLVGYPFYADYNVSKAGVIELTKSMALELAPDIRVVAICPGYVMTPMQQAEYSEEMLEAVNSKIPLGRHAEPKEIAALMAFLASDEAPYISGQPIVIDGGETAGGLASG